MNGKSQIPHTLQSDLPPRQPPPGMALSCTRHWWRDLASGTENWVITIRINNGLNSGNY